MKARIKYALILIIVIACSIASSAQVRTLNDCHGYGLSEGNQYLVDESIFNTPLFEQVHEHLKGDSICVYVSQEALGQVIAASPIDLHCSAYQNNRCEKSVTIRCVDDQSISGTLNHILPKLTDDDLHGSGDTIFFVFDRGTQYSYLFIEDAEVDSGFRWSLGGVDVWVFDRIGLPIVMARFLSTASWDRRLNDYARYPDSIRQYIDTTNVRVILYRASKGRFLEYRYRAKIERQLESNSIADFLGFFRQQYLLRQSRETQWKDMSSSPPCHNSLFAFFSGICK